MAFTFRRLSSRVGLLCSDSLEIGIRQEMRVPLLQHGCQEGLVSRLYLARVNRRIEWRRNLPLTRCLKGSDHDLAVRMFLDSGGGLRYARNG